MGVIGFMSIDAKLKSSAWVSAILNYSTEEARKKAAFRLISRSSGDNRARCPDHQSSSLGCGRSFRAAQIEAKPEKRLGHSLESAQVIGDSLVSD